MSGYAKSRMIGSEMLVAGRRGGARCILVALMCAVAPRLRFPIEVGISAAALVSLTYMSELVVSRGADV